MRPAAGKETFGRGAAGSGDPRRARGGHEPAVTSRMFCSWTPRIMSAEPVNFWPVPAIRLQWGRFRFGSAGDWAGVMRSSAPATSKRTKNDCQGGERANSNQHPKIGRHRFLQTYRLGISPGGLGIWLDRLGQSERGQEKLALGDIALDHVKLVPMLEIL